VNLFKNRSVIIATKHRKEAAIAQVLEAQLGVKTVVPEQFDTDQFGTFSGEVERKDDPITTARVKCMKALELFGGDLVVASEGSFGTHPEVPMVQADEEWIMLLDRKNGWEIVGRALSLETNFAGRAVAEYEELEGFAQEAGFPDHGLILRDKENSIAQLHKGIQDWDILKEVFEKMRKEYGSIWVETDMRALYNPTRMNVIGQATQNLVERIKSLCPQCAAPGFWIHNVERGLPCAQCGAPTHGISRFIWSCQQCGHHEARPNPDKTVEDPMYCFQCNP
jgi:hypothetical protein